MTQNPSHDSSSLSRDEDKRLRELAEALQLDVQDFIGEWDAFTAVFTVADGLDGLTLQQVDPIFYLKNGAFTHGVFSRKILEVPVVRYVEARSHDRPFDIAVVFFTYDAETKGIETRVFWNNEAVTFLVTPDTWTSVAQVANPYREKKA